SALSFYHDKLQKWVAEPGDFEVLVGNASDHLPLKAKFTLQ
ncbi:MAG: fibronectin type III-like domain-contianing protein, partial [Prevotella buccalis]|nr:fibronectin type III-like domain-contianing protein [Hoylesella buccalis]